MDSGAASYRRFLNGDDDGLVGIIKEYKDGLILYLNTFTRDLDLAEDLMEDTFVKLVTDRPAFKGKSSFKTWLYAIARNKALDRLRRRRHDVPLSEVEGQIDDGRLLEDEYLRQDRKIAVHKALDALAPDQRQALYLSYIEGFDNREVAAIMKKSGRQIENLLYRAKASLKRELDREGFRYEDI